VEGIDVEKVTDWYLREVPGTVSPLEFHLIAGGHSNLTFGVTDAAGRRTVLRRPPLGQVLATAHDMGREHRIISALGPTSVPVAPAVGFCDDVDVNGAPFYVMELVEGTVVRDEAGAATMTPEQRRRASESIVDVLADIHAVDVDAVGLGDLGRKDAYIERQLKRWSTQYHRSRDLAPGMEFPGIERAFERLSATVPPQHGAAIVHGDYRLDNCMLADDGTIAAVLDWEICTLGDPLADVGLLWVYWTDPGTSSALPQASPTSLDGFLRRDDVLERYANASGRDLSDIDYYIAFGTWKLACIIAGVYSRYAAGAMGTDVDPAQIRGFAKMVEALADAAEQTAAQLG
jgi:aminoglycoside phosphotransferase (APT) family kinase protein